MKLPSDTIIAVTKLTHYLLAWKPRDDKSQWLATAGYLPENWRQLEFDLRHQILPLTATFVEDNRFGKVYRIDGQLVGPNGRMLRVTTIWMHEHTTNQTKFITLYPFKGD